MNCVSYMTPERIAEIEKKLADIEFYSPTMPLHWKEYHSMLRELLVVIKQTYGHGEGI